MKETSINFSIVPRALLALAALAGQPSLLAQSNHLTVDSPPKIMAKRDGRVEAKLAVHIQGGYHVNSNAPAEDYLIPIRLRWEPGPLTPAEVVFPKPEIEKYEFSETPLSVFSGDFQILTRFKVEAKAERGPGVLLGKLRYQACSHDTCYRPVTLEIRLPYEIQ
ncbi:MAG: protein-disulfide reductase DsbD domain-containing protein [Bryobacteraceae bacterium]